MEKSNEERLTKIKVTKPKPDMVRQGIHPAKLKEAGVDTEKEVATLVLELTHQGEAVLLSREYPATFERGPLLEAISAIQGKKLDLDELEDEFDLASLVGKEVLVVVEHRKGQGGNFKPSVALVLPTKYSLPTAQTKTPAEPEIAGAVVESQRGTDQKIRGSVEESVSKLRVS